MSDTIPDKTEQILSVHATFIHMVVFALLDPANRSELESHLQTAEQNGWQALSAAIRKVMSGQNDNSVFASLDDEDRIIIKAILLGVQNPDSLPPVPEQADPAAAAPGLANLLKLASNGDVEALSVLGNMAGQMAAAGGTMARLGASLKRLLDGERNIDLLIEGMDEKGQALIHSILKELNQETVH